MVGKNLRCKEKMVTEGRGEVGDQKFPLRSRGSFYGRGLRGEPRKLGRCSSGGAKVATGGGRRDMEVRGLRDGGLMGRPVPSERVTEGSLKGHLHIRNVWVNSTTPPITVNV